MKKTSKFGCKRWQSKREFILKIIFMSLVNKRTIAKKKQIITYRNYENNKKKETKVKKKKWNPSWSNDLQIGDTIINNNDLSFLISAMISMLTTIEEGC